MLNQHHEPGREIEEEVDEVDQQWCSNMLGRVLYAAFRLVLIQNWSIEMINQVSKTR